MIILSISKFNLSAPREFKQTQALRGKPYNLWLEVIKTSVTTNIYAKYTT